MISVGVPVGPPYDGGLGGLSTASCWAFFLVGVAVLPEEDKEAAVEIKEVVLPSHCNSSPRRPATVCVGV